MAIRHSPQFKDQVIQFSLAHPEQTLVHTAKQFGIGNSTLDKWLREHRLTNGGKARNDLSADQQRIRQLERDMATGKTTTGRVKIPAAR